MGHDDIQKVVIKSQTKLKKFQQISLKIYVNDFSHENTKEFLQPTAALRHKCKTAKMKMG
jgi:hypothetical protein